MMVQTSDQEEEQWRRKYLDHLDQAEKKEKEWAGIESVLKRAIGRLSVAAKGYNKTVDRHIEEIRIATKDEINLHRLEMIIDDLSSALTRVTTEQTVIPILQKLVTGLELPKSCEKDRAGLLKRLARETDNAGEAVVREIIALLQKAVTGDKPGLFGRLLPSTQKPGPSDDDTDNRPEDRTTTEVISELNKHVHWPVTERKAAQDIEAGLKQQAKGADALITEYAFLINSLLSTNSLTDPVKKPEIDRLSDELSGMLDQRNNADTDPQVPELPAGDSRPEIREVLSRLLEQLAVPDSLNKEVEDLKKRLDAEADSSDWMQLLKDITSLVNSIRSRMQQEKHEFEVFLQQITTRLKDMDQYLKNEASSISTAQQEGMDFDTRVKSHVNDIRDDINTAIDLDALKTNVEKRLSTISQHIRDYRETEQERQDSAKKDILNMQNQMLSMEKETENLRQAIAIKNREAMIDVLTKLPNRLAYQKRAETEIARWKRFNSPLCLAICDIDHFKRINDSYGHKAGDKALRTVAKLLGKRLREIDFLARIGGEEFVILLPGTNENDALPPLDDIRESVATSGFHYRDKAVTITVSFGVSAFHQEDSLSDVFERADAALYRAKENGRNRIELATRDT